MDLARRLAVRPGIQAALAGTIAFATYLRTLAPTVMWYDMGEFAIAAAALGIAHNTGYPLFILLGKLFTFLPVGDVAYRVNLMSAAFGALTVALAFLITLRITGCSMAGWVGALTLAFSSTLWSNATWAISYDLNAFLTALVFLMLLRWRDSGARSNLNWALFLFGLGFGNHRLIAVMALPIAYFLWRGMKGCPQSLSVRNLFVLAGAFWLGFSVNLYLPLRAAQDPLYMWADASVPTTFLRMIITGAVSSSVFINPLRNSAEFQVWQAVLAGYPAYELTVPGLLVAAMGGWDLGHKRRTVFAITVMVMASALIMISFYGIHNIYNYFQPIYLMAALWIGCGVSRIMGEVSLRLKGQSSIHGWNRLPRLVSLLIAVSFLAIPAYLLGRNLPLLDRSQHRDARDFARYVLTSRKPDEIVLADFWSWSPLKYMQLVEGVGKDVTVLPAISDPDLDQVRFLNGLLRAGAPVYVAIGSEDSPRLAIPRERLQLIGPYVIQSFTTPSRPMPQFKDLLVPQGMLYRAVQEAPNLAVDRVPERERVEVEFEGGIWLRGFRFAPNPVAIGEQFNVHYYWQIDSPVADDYWIDVLFTDGQGNVSTQGGFPIWLHSHWLGGGPFPPGRWNAGQLYREGYEGLVPRSVEPGDYQVRVVLYRGGIRADLVRPVGSVGTAAGVQIGAVTVISPDG
jgi:hypothetical protein